MHALVSRTALAAVCGVLGVTLLARAASGQAPWITPQGDPSVASDTIYKLAVDSGAYPEQGAVLLLDDGVVQMEKDGRTRRTWREVVQILRDRAVQQYQERQLTYEPDRQHLTVNWVRVVKPSGEVISAAPAHTQESDLPAAMVNPVYMHQKSMRMSLNGVAPGTIVDMSYTVDDTTPYRSGDFFQSWFVSMGTVVRRSRFVVDVPRDQDLHIVERNLNFPRRETVGSTRKTFTWWTHDVAWNRPEMYTPSPDSDDLAMSVSVASAASWSDIGRWYAKLSADRMRADLKLRDTVKTIVAHAKTRADSIRAIHRWVAQDIRYVALELGIGGYQPRLADTVLATGFGDCKDKASLFIAALGVIGVDAYPVLLEVGNRPDRTLPTIGAFNHEIAAIKNQSGYQFVDLTSDLSPFGTLPFPDADAFAVIVHPDGHTEEVTTPADSVGANHMEIRVTGALTTEGVFGGHVEIRGAGSAELAMRSIMRSRMDSSQRSTYMRSLAAATFPNAKGDSLVTFDGKDLTAEPRISIVVRDGQATQHTGESDILVPQDASTGWTRLADELEARTPRRHRIDASKVIALAMTSDARITLPVGWHARLPSNVTAASAFGSYQSEYRQDGRDLIITHRVSGARGILPRDRAPELVAWFRAMAKDRVPFILIDHGASPPSAPGDGASSTR